MGVVTRDALSVALVATYHRDMSFALRRCGAFSLAWWFVCVGVLDGCSQTREGQRSSSEGRESPADEGGDEHEKEDPGNGSEQDPPTAGGGASGVAGGGSSSGGSFSGGAGPGGGGDWGSGGTGAAGVDGSGGAVSVEAFPSCRSDEGTECQGESCCTSIELAGQTFSWGRGRSPDDGDFFAEAEAYFGDEMDDEVPEVSVRLTGYRLDKYEVTVGRFRRFVEAYEGVPPQAGAGAHPKNEASGWLPLWDDQIALDRDALVERLACGDEDEKDLETWTSMADGRETLPINCVDWWTAFQFCIWDEGRLPTEAEWEYAAAGGRENRYFPWGRAEEYCTRANLWACDGTPEKVGDFSPGKGAFGHLDLAGNLWEWTFDVYEETVLQQVEPGTEDPIRTDGSEFRSVRGSWFFEGLSASRATRRVGLPNYSRRVATGMRCARDLPQVQ